MAATSKMELILELKNKLFNQKLMETQKKFTAASDKMRGNISKLKNSHIKAFNAMKAEVPGLSRGLDLITNKYVLMAAAAVGVGVLLYSATNKAIAFNHEFLQIKQMNLNKPRSEMEAYKNTIRDTAFTVGTDLNKTTQAFYDVQSATGLFGDEAKKVVAEVGLFSVATGSDLNDSINATTKAMKAFGLGANDIKGYLESNAKTVQTGIVSYAELAKVQTEYAGAAAGAGQSIDTANKLFAVFTSIAGGVSQGANMTKTAFQGLTQASTIKGLKGIGISLYDSNGQIRDLSKVVEEVATKFKKMSPKEIDVLINKIGGPEGLRNMFTKLKTGSEDFFKTLTDYDSSSFNLNKAFENAKGDVSIMSDMVKNRFGVVMATLGEKILPIVFYGLEKINKGIMWAYSNWGSIAPVVYTIVTALTALKVSTWLATGGFKTMFMAINTGIKSIPVIGWIIAAITALVGVIMWAKENVQGWGEQWKSIMDFMRLKGLQIKFELKTIWGGIEHAFLTMVDGIVLAWKWGQNMIGNISDKQYAKEKANIRQQQKDRAHAIRTNALASVKLGQKAKEALQFKLKLKKDTAAEEGSILETGSGGTLTPPNGLLDVNGNGGGGNSAAGDVTKVVGAGQQVKNITVNIDALNKGGINTSNTTLAKMSADEIEKWFNESIMRTIRNLELSI